MLNELKIFFDNVKNFRQLLTEGVSDRLLVDAINNYKYLHIYYDNNDDTIETGWRVIRPCRLGLLQTKNPTDNSGHLALRAWQDEGGSDAYYSPRKGKGYWHDIHKDTDGKLNPGWRLFMVHNITHAYPTGKRFVDDDGNPLIPPNYKETDVYIPTAIAQISIRKPDVPKKPLGTVVAPAILTKKGRKITKTDVEGLYNAVVKKRKEATNSFMVTTNDRGEFLLRPIKYKDTIQQKYPNEKYVGDLVGLYNQYVRKPIKTIDPEVDKFINKEKEKTIKDLQAQEVKENIEKSPIERKTFFK